MHHNICIALAMALASCDSRCPRLDIGYDSDTGDNLACEFSGEISRERVRLRGDPGRVGFCPSELWERIRSPSYLSYFEEVGDDERLETTVELAEPWRLYVVRFGSGQDECRREYVAETELSWTIDDFLMVRQDQVLFLREHAGSVNVVAGGLGQSDLPFDHDDPIELVSWNALFGDCWAGQVVANETTFLGDVVCSTR